MSTLYVLLFCPTIGLELAFVHTTNRVIAHMFKGVYPVSVGVKLQIDNADWFSVEQRTEIVKTNWQTIVKLGRNNHTGN